MLEFKRASELGVDVRPEISGIFTEGFSQWLTFFSKDQGKLTRAFTHMFRPELFYVAVLDGEIAAITACTNGIEPSVRLNKAEFTKHLGFIRGLTAYYILRREFEKHPYPFELAPGTGSVEFVATAAKHRSKGIATALIRHIMRNAGYSNYVLEVADTNECAVKVYSGLGFRECMRIQDKHGKQSGVNFFIYMKCEQPADK